MIMIQIDNYLGSLLFELEDDYNGNTNFHITLNDDGASSMTF